MTGLSPGVPSQADGWGRFAVFLIVGYLCMTRSFAYLGIPWISLYVGEIALAAFLIFGPRTNRGPRLQLAWDSPRLRRFESVLLLLLCYGALEAVRGISSGYPAFTAARDTAFNYYPIFLFLGVWVGLRDRDFLRRAAHALAWWNGCYGLAYLLILSDLPWTLPGTSKAATDVLLFGQPYGSAVALLGLIAFEPRLRRVWHLIALNIVVMFWVQIRAEWVGFAMGSLLFAWCTKRLKPLATAAAAAALLLAVMYLANIDLPSPETRGGRISADNLVARAMAPFNRDMAENLASKQDVNQFAGNAEWRLVWWAEIWDQVHSTTSSSLLGLGYGYPIGDLNPFIEGGYFIQTPHNSFFYALGYSGWIGVMLFGLLQIELLRLLWGSYKITGQPFGLMCWAALLSGSMFEDFFEAPFGAIPFYLLIGAALAPRLLNGGVAPARAVALSIPPRAPVVAAEVGK
jgi:hypothetical protein